jgi:tetratricopeptide (TPR) repeat protein
MEALAVLANITSMTTTWCNNYRTLPLIINVIENMMPQTQDEILIYAGLAKRACQFMIQNGMHTHATLRMARAAIDSYDKLGSGNELSLIETIRLYASAQLAREEYQDAENNIGYALGRCLKIKDKCPGLQILRISLCNFMSHTLIWQDKPDQAVIYARASVDLSKDLANQNEELVLHLTLNVGTSLRILNKYEEAAEVFLNIISNLKDATKTKPDLVDAQRTAILNYADLLVAQKKYDDAERMYHDLITELEANNGKRLSTYVLALTAWGSLQFRRGKLDEAETTLSNAVQLSETLTRDGKLSNDPYSLEWMALVLDAKGKQGANEFYLKAIKSYERIFGPGDSRAKLCLESYDSFLKHGPGKSTWSERASDTSSYKSIDLIL